SRDRRPRLQRALDRGRLVQRQEALVPGSAAPGSREKSIGRAALIKSRRDVALEREACENYGFSEARRGPPVDLSPVARDKSFVERCQALSPEKLRSSPARRAASAAPSRASLRRQAATSRRITTTVTTKRRPCAQS